MRASRTAADGSLSVREVDWYGQDEVCGEIVEIHSEWIRLCQERKHADQRKLAENGEFIILHSVEKRG